MKKEFMGFSIDICTFQEAVNRAVEYIQTDDCSAQVITINPEMYKCAEKDAYFSQIIRDSEMIIPDGVGVKIGLIINGIKAERIPGIDFAKELIKVSAQNGYKVAIIGAKEEIITKAVDNLKKEFPNLNIVYFHNGYFADDNEIYRDLEAESPDLILAAMGSPRQEKFIYDAKKVLSHGLMVGIGGSLDVWSGVIKRAPKIFQVTGTEWLYRTINQPSRFKRIFPTLPMFLLKSFKYKFFK